MSDPETRAVGRILVAEDDGRLSFAMASALEAAGHEVAVAADGEECLAKVHTFHPDLILLDLMMPEVHGIEVLKQLRADPSTRDVAVIVCTGMGYQTEHSLATELGALDFLIKPVDIRDLLQRVETFLSAKGGDSPSTTAAPVAVRVGEEYQPALETARGRFSLWGTRGSTPTPGADFIRHGGNTSCMEVEYGDDRFIFDAGSGIRELGLDLMKGNSRRLYIFITHTHWDHIQGFPFFVPAYVPGFEITVYGAEGFGKSLEALFRGQLDRDYFPVQMEDMNADIEFRHLTSEPLRFGDVTVSWEYVQHPGATVGYKIDVAGTTLAWIPDNEFLQGYVGVPDAISLEEEIFDPYRNVIEFLTDVDVLIHEAQYPNDQYVSKIGWGHSSVSNACLLAKLARVKRWIVTHHDPMHDDRFLETKLSLTRQQLRRLGHDIPLSHGHDGLVEFL